MPCFLIGATGTGVTSTGEAFVAGVSDDPYLFRTFVRAVLPSSESKELAHIGTELRYDTKAYPPAKKLPPPFEWAKGQPSRGTNAAGLAFTCALAVETAAPEDSTVSPTSFEDLCLKMMKKCTTVDEAVGVLLAEKAVAPGFTVLLADVAGHLAQVEVGAHGCAVHKRYSKDEPGIVVAVNCHQCAEHVKHNTEESKIENDTGNNGRRLARGWELAERHRGKIDVGVLASILADRENDDVDCSTNNLIPYWGHSICNRGTKKSKDYDAAAPPWGTVSGEIMQPSTCAMHYCYGWPCGHKQEYGDQLFQDKSWGRFEAFAVPPAIAAESREKEKVVECATIHGVITARGKDFLPPPAAVPLDPAPEGAVEMKVTAKKSGVFYARAASRLLQGSEARPAQEGREALEAKAPADALRISGVGDSINAAITAASAIETDGLGVITRIQTAYPVLDGGANCAQIIIDVKKK